MRRFRKTVWAVHLLLVGVAAFFGAEGLSAVAKMAILRGMPDALGQSLGPRAHVDAAGRAASSDPILERNPFDSVTGSLLRAAHAGEPPGGDEGYDPLHIPPCEKVRAVVIAEFVEPAASLAAFEVEGEQPVLRRQGGELGGSRVEYIAPDRVFLRRDGAVCQAQLFAPRTTDKPRTIATPRTEGDPGAIDPSIASGIERVGPGRYRVDRSVMQRLLDDQAEIFKGGMMRPEKEGDRTVGVRLFAVRPDRLFGLLGLQDGDVMRNLNGYEFSSPERMLEAYAHLRDATELRIDFTRGGQAISQTYSIQ